MPLIWIALAVELVAYQFLSNNLEAHALLLYHPPVLQRGKAPVAQSHLNQ